jgi:hypothetical protein
MISYYHLEYKFKYIVEGILLINSIKYLPLRIVVLNIEIIITFSLPSEHVGP